jgi:cell division protein FtsW
MHFLKDWLDPDSMRRMDPFLLFTTLALLGFGIIMVYSASFVIAGQRFGDPYHFLKKQAIAALVGMGLMFGVSRIDYHRWRVWALPALLLSLLLLAALLVPGFRQVIGGSARWLRLWVFSFQPSEMAKLALVIYMARSLARKEDRMDSFTHGFLPPAVVLLVFFFLVIKQPDFGAGLVFALVVFTLLFVAGTPLRYLLGAVLLALPAAYWILTQASYRAKRWEIFWDPWSDPENAGFQLIQSFLAFGAGKLSGVGLAQGRQKLFYLPEIHTDFILSVIGEELGFIGVMAVVILFFIIIFRAFRTSLRAPDLFGTYLAVGIAILLAVQILIHMGVALGLLPTKGSTLPFISYGGTSLVVNLTAVGILLNISTHRETMNHEDPDRRGRDGRSSLPRPGRR